MTKKKKDCRDCKHYKKCKKKSYECHDCYHNLNNTIKDNFITNKKIIMEKLKLQIFYGIMTIVYLEIFMYLLPLNFIIGAIFGILTIIMLCIFVYLTTLKDE